MKTDLTLENGNQLTIDRDNRREDAVFVHEFDPITKSSAFSRFDEDGAFIEGSDTTAGDGLEGGLTEAAVKAVETELGIELSWA